MPKPANRTTLVVPLALAFSALFGLREPGPADAQVPEAKPAVTPAPKATAYDHTAIGVVIRANYGRVPSSGSELMRALKKVGDFAQLPVVFSAVNPNSGLTTPRVIIAPRPGAKTAGDAEAPDPKEKGAPVRPGGFGLPGFPGFPGGLGGAGLPGVAVGGRPGAVPAINTAKATENYVEGRLFFAANFEKDDEGQPRVKAIEFISWNARKKRFDFGVIECGFEPAELQILDGVRCFSCHKNKGPILGLGPWSNSMHNDVARAAALQALVPKNASGVPEVPIPSFEPGVAGMPVINPKLKEKTTFDGISLVFAEPEVCDQAIRQGANLARDREVYRAMAKSPDGRKSLTILLAAIATHGPIEQASQQAKQPMDLAFNINYGNFGDDFSKLQKSMPDTLLDFSPSGSMGSLRTTTTNEPAGWGSGSFQRTDTRLIWGGDVQTVENYDAKRSTGETGMPSSRQPSNPKAFVPPPTGAPPRPSSVVNAVSLARLIGVTEGDRKFMADAIQLLASQINKPKVTAATLAREVFGAPSFLDALKVQDIPDREEFKDRFVAAVAEVSKTYKLSDPPKFSREDYASGPNFAAVPGKEEKEVAVVPTTACLRCHDVRGVGKPGFNPIPMLAFDPFDKASREAWVKNADAKKRVDVLGKFVKRLSTDQDMPPEDAPEHEKFRAKDKATFDAVTAWLDAELKKAKGN